jgi:hypothetical protein
LESKKPELEFALLSEIASFLSNSSIQFLSFQGYHTRYQEVVKFLTKTGKQFEHLEFSSGLNTVLGFEGRLDFM